jgi:hypothetical protein
MIAATQGKTMVSLIEAAAEGDLTGIDVRDRLKRSRQVRGVR